MIKFKRECHTLNRRGHTTHWWHRLWCRQCRDAQEIDAMIGFGLMQIQDAPSSASGLTDTLFALDLSGGGKAVRRAARHVGIYKLMLAGRVGAVSLLMFAVWWQYMNYIPAMQIPSKQLPTPNAFTYFKEAGAKSQYSTEVGFAIGPPTKDAKPTPRIDKIETEMNEGEQPSFSKVRRIFDSDHLYTLADKQLLLDANLETLATLRQGLDYDYAEPYIRSIKTAFPYYAKFRSMARLLSLEATVREAKGDWNGGMQSRLDAIQLGVKIPHGAPLIGDLVGIACQAIGRHGIWNCVSHLNATETRAAITRLEIIRAQQVPYAEILREEEWMSLENMRDVMRDPRWRITMGITPDPEQRFDWHGLILLGWSNRVMLGDMQIYMDKMVALSHLSYPQEKALAPLTLPQDPLSQMLLPIFSMGRFRETSSMETQNALLLTTLALHAYALEHAGQYPLTLQALTPGYVKQAPVDPFALSSAPLRYRKSNRELDTMDYYKPEYPGQDDYVLYSVGPDGKDDGGLPIDAMQHKPISTVGSSVPKPDDNNRFYVNEASTGDIVAGLNVN